MLASLTIRDIVLIDKLDLELGAGLTILTGETGAGKSILLDAFALALGARGDGALVRSGQPQGQVTAVFDLAADHPARALVLAQDIGTEGDLILRRIQMADGRTRAFVNDQPVSGGVLRAIAAGLVEIHGQHDDRALTDPALHRTLVDAYGGLEPLCKAVRSSHAARKAAAEALATETARIEKARGEADYLRHAHAELTKLAPRSGEEEALATRRTAMQQAEKVASELQDAYENVGGQASPIPGLSSVMRRLQRREMQAPHLITASVKALDEALIALDIAQSALDQALRDANFDPRELENTEERLFALRAAARKYTVSTLALPELAAKFKADLAALDASEVRIAGLAKTLAAAKAAYGLAAGALSAARKTTAAALDKAVGAELKPLKLDRARFITQIDVDASLDSAEGRDRVEFWVETNPGTRPGPLMKVASGGELARFMLALKVVLADRGSAPTLVFDEIDTGVGGAVADAIGQRLARLAGRVQVLAVTHAPQVAAKASGHYRIAKLARDGGRSVATGITWLDAPARREEIARMLSGADVTDEARAAAARLLAQAG